MIWRIERYAARLKTNVSGEHRLKAAKFIEKKQGLNSVNQQHSSAAKQKGRSIEPLQKMR